MIRSAGNAWNCRNRFSITRAPNSARAAYVAASARALLDANGVEWIVVLLERSVDKVLRARIGEPRRQRESVAVLVRHGQLRGADVLLPSPLERGIAQRPVETRIQWADPR